MKKRKRIKHKTTVRTRLPLSYWRLLNHGTPFEKEDIIESLRGIQSVVPMVIAQHKVIDEAVAEIIKLRRKHK